MKSMHNVEKSVFRKGEYVGYADGAWRIVKVGKLWRAVHQNGKHWSVKAKTLEDVSKSLDKVSGSA